MEQAVEHDEGTDRLAIESSCEQNVPIVEQGGRVANGLPHCDVICTGELHVAHVVALFEPNVSRALNPADNEDLSILQQCRRVL